MYNMPAKFTTDIQQLAPEWHSDQYDYDQVRHAVMRAPQHRVQSKVTATSKIRGSRCKPCTRGCQYWGRSLRKDPSERYELVSLVQESLCDDAQHGLQVLHEHFQGSSVRTEDPEQAQLFMIPVYLGRYYNWFWQQWSTPGSPWEIVEDCEPRHRAGSPECWWEKWMWAKGVSFQSPW